MAAWLGCHGRKVGIVTRRPADWASELSATLPLGSGFKYFSSFRKFAEMPDVLAGRIPGRESEDERILSYSTGIAMHDMVFAHHAFNALNG